MNESTSRPTLSKRPSPPRKGAELRWLFETAAIFKRSPVPLLACGGLLYAMGHVVNLLSGHQQLREAFRIVFPATFSMVGPFLICAFVLIRIADLGLAQSDWRKALKNARTHLWVDLILLPCTMGLIASWPLLLIQWQGPKEPLELSNYVRLLCFSISFAPALAGLFQFQCSLFDTGDLIALRQRARRAVGVLSGRNLFAILSVPAGLTVMAPAIGGGVLIVFTTLWGVLYQYCAWREVFGRAPEELS